MADQDDDTQRKGLLGLGQEVMRSRKLGDVTEPSESLRSAMQPVSAGAPFKRKRRGLLSAHANAELLAALEKARKREAQQDKEFDESLGDLVVEKFAQDGGFFSAVGSVDAAVQNSGKAIDTEATKSMVNELGPHDLLALKEQTIGPTQLGYTKPDGLDSTQYNSLVASYASAELLDRERQLHQTNAEEERRREDAKLKWDIFRNVLAFLIGAATRFLG